MTVGRGHRPTEVLEFVKVNLATIKVAQPKTCVNGKESSALHGGVGFGDQSIASRRRSQRQQRVAVHGSVLLPLNQWEQRRQSQQFSFIRVGSAGEHGVQHQSAASSAGASSAWRAEEQRKSANRGIRAPGETRVATKGFRLLLFFFDPALLTQMAQVNATDVNPGSPKGTRGRQSATKAEKNKQPGTGPEDDFFLNKTAWRRTQAPLEEATKVRGWSSSEGGLRALQARKDSQE